MAARQRRLILLQRIELDDGVGRVRPTGAHLLLAQDVARSQLDEGAALGKAGQARVDEAFGGETVEDDVNAGATSDGEDFLAVGRRPAIENVPNAKALQVGLFRRARRREHLGTSRLRQLDRRQANAARAGVDQHTVALLETRGFVGQRRRQKHGRHRRKRRPRDIHGYAGDELLMGDDFRREGSAVAAAYAHHAVACGYGRHCGSDLDDAATHLRTEKLVVDQAQCREHVPEVEPRCLDGEAHLVRLERCGCQGQAVERVVADAHDPSRTLRQGQPGPFAAGADEARGHPPPTPVGNMRLGVRMHQFQEHVRLGCRVGRIEVEHPHAQLRGLPGGHLAESPHGGAGQLAGALALKHLRAAGDQPHSLGGCRVGIQDALHHGQRAAADAADISDHGFGGRVHAGTGECR